MISSAKPEVFSRLRDWRKTVAEQEGVPVYVVFTNEQLAEMFRKRAANKTQLAAIEGVGEGSPSSVALLRRVEKQKPDGEV